MMLGRKYIPRFLTEVIIKFPDVDSADDCTIAARNKIPIFKWLELNNLDSFS